MSSTYASTLVQISSLTIGKDTVCRFFQYGCKFSSWILPTQYVEDVYVQHLKNVEWSISTARKLFRIGKSVEQFHFAQKELSKGGVIGKANSLDKITSGMYLLCDHMVWFARMKLFSLEEKYWNRQAARFWLLSLVFSILRSVCTLVIIFQKSSKNMCVADFVRTVMEHSDIMVESLKNLADLFIPLNTLDMISLPSGIIGLIGVITSLIRLHVLWKKSK